MPRKQRLAVIILFSLGFLVTAAGIVRTYYIYESLVVRYDNTWYAYPLWFAAAVEIDLGVVSLLPISTVYLRIETNMLKDLRLRPRPTPPSRKAAPQFLLQRHKGQHAGHGALPVAARRCTHGEYRPPEHALVQDGFAAAEPGRAGRVRRVRDGCTEGVGARIW